MLQILCLTPIVSSSITSSANAKLHPIVLVPGAGGNQLEARLTAQYEPSSFICKAYPGPFHRDRNGWYRIWFDPTVLLGPYTQCFSERMTLYYDPDSDDYHNAPGVETRVPHFGSTRSLLYLDPNLKLITSYMEPLVRSLEELGYKDGETLFGDPYDFRYGLAAEGHPSRVGSEYLDRLKRLIEEASASIGGRPVVILSHSLGALYAHQLLLRSPLGWRRRFVKHLVALSAPWGGTVQEMLTFASGSTLGVPLVDPLLVRAEQRSSESNLWLMPSPSVFGLAKPLVITTNGSYSAGDIPRFLRDIGYPQGAPPYTARVLPMVEELRAPGVPVTSIVGSGVKTPETLCYGEKGFDEQPSIGWGDGDGTVNMVSLVAIEAEWRREKEQFVRVVKLDGVSHTGILSDRVSLDRILNVISEVNSDVVGLNLSVM